MQKRRETEPTPEVKPEVGKEDYYLRFNKDEIFKNLIASEGHFRNVVEKKEEATEAGFMNCIVKHLADAEGHADEAVSHSAVVQGAEASRQYQDLRDGIKDLRWKLQESVINPFDGIREVRRLRRMFESFNPDFDISKCKACEPVETLMKKAIEQQKECATPQSET